MIDEDEVHRKSWSREVKERREAVEVLGRDFGEVSDKARAWEDLHRLTSDQDIDVRWGADDVSNVLISKDYTIKSDKLDKIRMILC